MILPPEGVPQQAVTQEPGEGHGTRPGQKSRAAEAEAAARLEQVAEPEEAPKHGVPGRFAGRGVGVAGPTGAGESECGGDQLGGRRAFRGGAAGA